MKRLVVLVAAMLALGSTAAYAATASYGTVLAFSTPGPGGGVFTHLSLKVPETVTLAEGDIVTGPDTRRYYVVEKYTYCRPMPHQRPRYVVTTLYLLIPEGTVLVDDGGEPGPIRP